MYQLELIFLRIFPRLRGVFIRLWIVLNGGTFGADLIVEGGGKFKYPVHKGVRTRKKVCLGKHTKFDVPRSGELLIGNDVSFTGFLYLSAVEKDELGNHVIIDKFCSIQILIMDALRKMVC